MASSSYCSSNHVPTGGRWKRLNDAVFEVYRPANNYVSMEIVFFHGFQTHGCNDAYYRTWMKGDDSGCWLDTWLKERFPNARILSVSYNSSLTVSSLTGQQDMHRLGEALAYNLIELGGIGQRCPVVLVAHCVGGMVLKEHGWKIYGVVEASETEMQEVLPYLSDITKSDLEMELQMTKSDLEMESSLDFDTLVTISVVDHFTICKPQSTSAKSFSALSYFVEKVCKDEDSTQESSSGAPRSSDKSLRADAVALGFKDFEVLFDPSRTLFIHFPSQDPGNAGAVEIVFFHHKGMAALSGVVVQFSKVVLRPDRNVEVHEVGKTVWIPSNNQVGSLALLDANVLMGPETTVNALTTHVQVDESLKLAQGASVAAVDSGFRSFFSKASGESGGSTTSGAVETEVNDSGNSGGEIQLHTDSEGARDVLRDDHKAQREFTVIIHLNPDDSKASEYRNKQTMTVAQAKQECKEIEENIIQPVISITFKKQDSGQKRFTTVVNVNYFMKCDENCLRTRENTFGWYHDQLRLSFKCMEANAVTIGKRNYCQIAEEKTFHHVLVDDRSTTDLEGRSLDAKLHAGNRNAATAEISLNLKKESTDTTTKRQESTSSNVRAGAKFTNFVIMPEGGPSEIACLASLTDHYDVWDTCDREEASRSGRMSNVPIMVLGKWRVTDNPVTAEKFCKYHFESERTFIKLQKCETSRKPHKLKKLKKLFGGKKSIKGPDVLECRIKQQITKSFDIDHTFFLDRLKDKKKHFWYIATSTEPPSPVSDIIKGSSPSLSEAPTPVYDIITGSSPSSLEAPTPVSEIVNGSSPSSSEALTPVSDIINGNSLSSSVVG